MDTAKKTITTGEPVEEQAPSLDPDKVYSIIIDKDVFEETPPCQIARLFESMYIIIMDEKPSYITINNFHVSIDENKKLKIDIY